MAKAEYTTAGGTKITLEGTPKEVADLIRELNASSGDSPKEQPVKQRRAGSKTTATNLIGSMIDGGFFKKPKGLASIKIALEEGGHFYPITTLSPVLLRFVRRRDLRRIKDKNKWLYTG